MQHIEDQFFLAVYDMGAGIPQTLSTKSWLEDMMEDIQKTLEKINLTTNNDAKKIKAAVEYGRSRFKQDKHGKGLSDAKDFVQANPMGNLIIYSGYGSYSFRSDNRNEELTALPLSFKGTLIQWNLHLEPNNGH